MSPLLQHLPQAPKQVRYCMVKIDAQIMITNVSSVILPLKLQDAWNVNLAGGLWQVFATELLKTGATANFDYNLLNIE